MLLKLAEQKEAIRLRQQGKTYAEILTIVPVAKSTLSLWLRDIGLAKVQRQRISAKKLASQKKGAEARHLQRVISTKDIHKKALEELGTLTLRELFLIGVALYWAEGSKEKKEGKSTMIDFANSDPEMVRLFVTWLLMCAGVKKEEIVVRLHLHVTHANRESEIKSFWSEVTGIHLSQFGKTNFKKHNPKTKRKNIEGEYRGLVSIRVVKSTKLNRRIQGLIYAIIAQHKNCQIV